MTPAIDRMTVALVTQTLIGRPESQVPIRRVAGLGGPNPKRVTCCGTGKNCAASSMGGLMELNRDFSDFIASRIPQDACFMIADGYAADAHGPTPVRQDLGAWLTSNADRMVGAIGGVSCGSVGLSRVG